MIIKEKLTAFLIHMGISICIALLCIGLIFFIWYPLPLASAVGVTKIFLLILGIDVILGPLLTLLVYKKDKNTLFFDLIVIALLQVAALSYGLWAVYQGKPAWLVFNVDRFDVVRMNEIDQRKIKLAQSEYQQPSKFFPKWVAAIPPKNLEENNQILFEAVFSGVDIAQRPQLYCTLRSQHQQIQKKALDLKSLYQFNGKGQVDKFLSKYSEANAYLPLKANAVDMTVLINKETTEIVKIVDLRPWH